MTGALSELDFRDNNEWRDLPVSFAGVPVTICVEAENGTGKRFPLIS
jgi:hypothetical protein